MKIKDIKSLDEFTHEILKEYNDCMDKIIDAIDNSMVQRKFNDAMWIATELEQILKDSDIKKPKWFMAWLFGGEKQFVKTIRSRTDAILTKYKNCYEALKEATSHQIGKGLVIDNFLKWFEKKDKEVDSMIEKYKCDWTLESKMIYEGLKSFSSNMKKLYITMQQRIAVMEQTLKSSMQLKEEMWAWLHHFESLIKDILISLSFDSVIKTAAAVMNSFRSTIEEYNEAIASKTIETAREIHDIKDKWIVSLDYLKSMSNIITSSIIQFNALEDKSVKNQEELKTQLTNISQKALTFKTK